MEGSERIRRGVPLIPATLAALTFSANGFRGFYLINKDNSYRPTIDDVRLGCWYALTH